MTTFTTLDDYLSTLPEKEQIAIQDEAKQLKQAYKLSQLRQACQIKQTELAERMGVSQANISKVENGNDVHLSTLQKYVNALGGEIQITAKMPQGEIKLI